MIFEFFGFVSRKKAPGFALLGLFLSGIFTFGCMWQHGIFFMIMSLLILTLLGISSHVFLAFNNAIAIYIHVDGG